MPCNCDHLEPTKREAESVKVMELVREITGKPFDHKNPHHGPYGNTDHLNAYTAHLCEWCWNNPGKLKDMSLELQIWWRDHQEADKAKEEQEELKREVEIAKARAISKLTLEERKALGVI